VAEAEATDRTFTTSLVRWALVVRLTSLLVLLVLPIEVLRDPRVVVAVALLAGWSLVWLAPGGGPLRYFRRHPIVVVGDVLLAVAVTGLVGVDSPLVLATLSTALVIGVLLPAATAWLVTTVLVMGYLLAALPDTSGRGELFLHVVVIPVTFVVLATLGGVTRRLHDRVLVEQARLAQARVAAAAAAERARLARDMHDSVAKSLQGVALAAAALPRWIEQDTRTAVRQAEAVREAAEQAAAEARDMLVELRRCELERDFAQRLADLVEDFASRTGLKVGLQAERSVDLRGSAADEALKVVGEALENVARHAAATRVGVEVCRDVDGQGVVRVTDDGRGFDPGCVAADRFGLVGMQERALQAGGVLELSSRPGAGTRVSLRIPQTVVGEVAT
jgi:signal transduction histidine kinase